jgi:Xaa-Pro aminopeptidase
MADRRRERISALLDSMDHAGLDGLLVSSLPNIRYLTGFSGSSALALVTRGLVTFITDFRYETQVAFEVGDLARVTIDRESLWAGLWRQLPALPNLNVVGFESAHVVHLDFQRLVDDGTRWRWRPTVGLVERLREQKDDTEVALIASAAAIAERALERLMGEVRAGMTELQVAGMLERMLREEGSEGFPFPTIIASGARAALPHARSTAKHIERGDLLLLDFGAEVGGYCADITRTVVVGPASVQQRDVYGVVRAANESAAAGVRANMACRDADAIAREYIRDRGFGDAFGHGLGHGLGLQVHEAPRLARTSDGPLQERSVVTIEPGIYLPGWGGVRIEDDVHVAADGPHVLTRFTHELLEIG